MINTPTIVDDVKQFNKQDTLNKVKHNSRLSSTFILLLLGSTIICTLGLVLNSTAIVIGGMIMSPLMWPLMRTAVGISYGDGKGIKNAIWLLFFSTLVCVFSAFIITLISPFKSLNDEIILRITPTILDIIIALVAGGLAAIAVSRTRVSENLAGIAVATSLMPPLCVSGIGLALLNVDIFKGSLLLYLTNVVSIIFASVIVFSWIGLKKRNEPRFQKKALTFLIIAIVFLTVPLGIYLQNILSSERTYNVVKGVLLDEFNKISEDSYVSNISTEKNNKKGVVVVTADVLLPEEVTIDFEDKNKIINSLKDSLGLDVSLNLRLQKTLSFVSEDDTIYSQTQKLINRKFIDKLAAVEPDLEVNTLDTKYDTTQDIWVVKAILIGDLSVSLNESEVEQIKQIIAETINSDVSIQIEILPRLTIAKEQDALTESIKLEVSNHFNNVSPEIKVDRITTTKILDENDLVKSVFVEVQVKSPSEYSLYTLTQGLKQKVQQISQVDAQIELKTVYFTTIKL